MVGEIIMAKSQRELWLLDLSGDYIFTKGTEEEIRQYLEKVIEGETAHDEFCHCDGVEKCKDKYLYAILIYESSFEDCPTIDFRATPLRNIASESIEELIKSCKKEEHKEL